MHAASASHTIQLCDSSSLPHALSIHGNLIMSRTSTNEVMHHSSANHLIKPGDSSVLTPIPKSTSTVSLVASNISSTGKKIPSNFPLSNIKEKKFEPTNNSRTISNVDQNLLRRDKKLKNNDPSLRNVSSIQKSSVTQLKLPMRRSPPMPQKRSEIRPAFSKISTL